MGNQLTVFLILFSLAFFSSKNFFAQEINDGCPDNSYCTKELGAKYLEWKTTLTRYQETKNSALLNDFLQTKGIPLSFWNPSKPDEKNYISWKSHYRSHLKLNYHLVLLYAKNTTTLPLSSAFQDELYLLQDNRIATYSLPQGELPVATDGENLIFSMEDDGIYFALSLSLNGTILLQQPIQLVEFPDTVDCPKELIENLKKLTTKQGLYNSKLCKTITDLRTKRTSIYLVQTVEKN